MKTGIVVELNKSAAVVLQPGGVFIECDAQPGWRLGDVVAIPPKKRNRQLWLKWAALVATVVLVLVSALAVNNLFFAVESLVSIDINPSFELSLNRRGNVVFVQSYNGEGNAMLDELDLKGKPYQEALREIFESDMMRPYLETNEYLEIAVYSKNSQDALFRYAAQLSDDLSGRYPGVQVNCYSTSAELVKQAHNHGVSIGKWKALSELQAADPTADIESLSHCGIDEIRHQLSGCQTGTHAQDEQGGNGETPGNHNNDSGNHNSGESGGNDHNSGQSNGHDQPESNGGHGQSGGSGHSSSNGRHG